MPIKKILIIFAIMGIIWGVLTAIVSAQTSFPGGNFTSSERSQLRAVNDWYKRCVQNDVPKCTGPTTTTTSSTTTTTSAPPTTSTSTSTTSTSTTTTTTAPPQSGGMPTISNTGPSGINGTMSAAQFLSTGICDHKRITDQVRDEAGAMLNRTFTINNCALDGGFYYANYGSYPDSAFPIVNIQSSSIYNWLMFSPMRVTADRVYVAEGAYWVPCPECGAQDHQPNQTMRAMPVTMTNSMFHQSRPADGGFYHAEALHVVGSGIGYSFNNVRFTQDGPWSNLTTGAIKFTGRNSTFRNVFFDWNGFGAGSYFTVYFEGTGLTIDGCRIENAVAGYQFDNNNDGNPDIWSEGNGYVAPPLQNCVDWNTGARI